MRSKQYGLAVVERSCCRARRSLQDFNAKSKRGDGMGDSKQVLT